MKVYIRDFKGTGYCPAGQKRFCDAHGIDWRDYVRNGVDAQVLLDSGDDMARAMVEIARVNREKGL